MGMVLGLILRGGNRVSLAAVLVLLAMLAFIYGIPAIILAMSWLQDWKLNRSPRSLTEPRLRSTRAPYAAANLTSAGSL